MGKFWDQIKSEYKKGVDEAKLKQAKSAERSIVQGKRLTKLEKVEYLGGYLDLKKSEGSLLVFESSIEFKESYSAESYINIDISMIKEVNIEGQDEVSKRVTVTRLLAVGVFAFALQKKTKHKDAFITFTLTDMQDVIFHVKNVAPIELKAQLGQTISHIRRVASQSK